MLNAGTILVVDDDENDLLMLERALQEAGVGNPVQTLHDGNEAIQYLKGEGPYSDREKSPLPCLMLLDLKLPKCNGFQVLDWRRNQQDLQHFPIIILSGSNLQTDIQRALELGATAYCEKPVGLNRLILMAKELREQCLEHDVEPRSARFLRWRLAAIVTWAWVATIIDECAGVY
jgi:CheY-like chemotaxis protein